MNRTVMPMATAHTFGTGRGRYVPTWGRAVGALPGLERLRLRAQALHELRLELVVDRNRANTGVDLVHRSGGRRVEAVRLGRPVLGEAVDQVIHAVPPPAGELWRSGESHGAWTSMPGATRRRPRECSGP